MSRGNKVVHQKYSSIQNKSFQCLFQAESDSCGSHDPSTHVLLKIYIAEESPLLFNENNDIIDQLALFDSLQIFKQGDELSIKFRFEVIPSLFIRCGFNVQAQ
jgi:hypothetical protein